MLHFFDIIFNINLTASKGTGMSPNISDEHIDVLELDKERQRAQNISREVIRQPVLKKIRQSIFPFLWVIGSFGGLIGGIASGITTNNTPNKENKINTHIPTQLLTIVSLGSIAVISQLWRYGKMKPFDVITHLKKLKWIESGKKTVSKDVFDALSFKTANRTEYPATKYSQLSRPELEKLIQYIDLSDFDKNKQQAFLQMIIDTCDKHPAMAHLFRQPIYPLKLEQQSLGEGNETSVAVYNTNPNGRFIQGEWSNLLLPENFMHEFAHATQHRDGLRLKNNRLLRQMTRLILETHSTAISHLCEMDELDPLLTVTICKQSQKEVSEEYNTGKIQLPDNLDTTEISRCLDGVAEDKTIGRIMEIFLSEPKYIGAVYDKMSLGQEVAPYLDNHTTPYVSCFQNTVAEEQAYQLIQKNPNLTQQFLNVFSQKTGYTVQPIMSLTPTAGQKIMASNLNQLQKPNTAHCR